MIARQLYEAAEKLLCYVTETGAPAVHIKRLAEAVVAYEAASDESPQAVAWEVRSAHTETGDFGPWEACTKELADEVFASGRYYARRAEARELYLAPPDQGRMVEVSEVVAPSKGVYCLALRERIELPVGTKLYAAIGVSGVRLSEWVTVSEICATRVIAGTDPDDVANRVAFIEKTPRVRMVPWSGDYSTDWRHWREGPKGCAPEYGAYQPSRDWCDAELVKLGYTLP